MSLMNWIREKFSSKSKPTAPAQSRRKPKGRKQENKCGRKGCFGGPNRVGRKMARNWERKANDYLSFLYGARRKKR